MKIGISTTSIEQHLTGGKRDGIGVYTDNLCSSLSRLEAIELERFYYPASIFDLSSPPAEVQSNRFHVPYGYSGVLSNILGMYDINHNVIENRVDLYHATDYKIPKLRKKPVVATLYDAIPLKHPEWVSGRIRWIKNKVLVNSARWADHVITISDYMVDDIVNFWRVPDEKVSVVHCGVSDFWFADQAEEEIRAVKKNHGISRPYILFVGTFQPRKNIGRIIEAYQALPAHIRDEYQLVLAGREGWKSEELVRSIAELESSGACVWVSNADDADLRCLYQGCEVFFFPSLTEGFGLPVLEAFASKVPVITSKGTALEEVAGGAALLVDPYSVEAMVAALTEALGTDSESRQGLIEKGLERCRLYSWDSAARKISDIYSKFV